jgi:plastocyanin
MPSRLSCLALALVAMPLAAHAQSIEGVIQDPSLRRKVDLVYVENAPATPPPAAAQPVMNQRGNTYLPHVLPVVKGTKVLFKSEDPELHNVFARGEKRVLFNQAVLPSNQFERVFNELGAVRLTCNIHKEMNAWVVVLPNGYFAAPDRKTGKFSIAGVPAGTYTIRIWGEGLSDADSARKFTDTVGASTAPLLVAAR